MGLRFNGEIEKGGRRGEVRVGSGKAFGFEMCGRLVSWWVDSGDLREICDECILMRMISM